MRDDLRTVAATGGHLGLVAGRRRAHPRAPPAAGVAARPDRVGHGAPGLRPQAAHRPPRPIPHPSPDRRPRRVPATHSPPTTSWTAGTPGPASPSPRDSPPPATSATRWSGSRSSSATRRSSRASPRGAQRHRAPADPAPDRPQRQRDVDQPVGGRTLGVPVRDRAGARLAAARALGHGDERCRWWDPGGRAERRFRQWVVWFAQPGGLFEPGITYIGVMPRATSVQSLEATFRRASRAERPGHRPRPDPEGEGLPAGRGRPGLVPRGRPAADADRAAADAHDRIRAPTAPRGRFALARPSWPTAAAGPPRPPGRGGRGHRAPRRAGELPATEAAQLHGLVRQELVALATEDRRIVGITAGMPTGRAVEAPGRLPGPVHRRRHRRAARRDPGHRPRAGRDAPGRRAVLDLPPAGVRPGRPRRVPERRPRAARGRPRRARRRGRDQPPGDVHASGAAPAAQPRHRQPEGRAGAAVVVRTALPRTTRSRSTTRATPGSACRSARRRSCRSAAARSCARAATSCS